MNSDEQKSPEINIDKNSNHLESENFYYLYQNVKRCNHYSDIRVLLFM